MHADAHDPVQQPAPAPLPPRCVLMTADAVGGVWEYALELGRELTRRGAAVTLATMGPVPTSEQAAAAGQIDGLRLVAGDYRLEWMDAPWEDVDRAAAWLLDLESEIGAEIVHLNGYAHGSLPWSAPALVVAHSCVCSWWEAVRNEPAPPEWDTYRSRVRAGLAGADAVVAPTRAMRDALARHYAFDAGVVIPNGRRASDFVPAAKEPLVFCAGRLWDDAKNAALLAAAAARVSWPVCIAGETRGGDAELSGGAGRAMLLGRLSPAGMRHWLGRAAICALPSKYEPFGLTALEAALAGCALVLGDIPSLRETWEDAASFVPTGDPDALAGAVSALIADERRRRSLAHRGRQRALTLTPQRMADAYVALYASLRRTPVALTRESAPCAS